MKKRSIIFPLMGLIVLVCIICSSCTTPSLEVNDNLELLNSFTPTSSFKKLNQGTTCYFDASSVGLEALKNSDVFKAMLGNISQYSDTLIFINGSNFVSVPLNRSQQSVFNALESMKEKNEEVDYAKILLAVENICNGDHQGMIITDFEYIQDGRYQDINPYLSEPFKNWLSRGYQIDFLVEKYAENKEIKKRFYAFFTDPTDDAPINMTLKNCVQKNIDNNECTWITVNATDYLLTTISEENSCNTEISMIGVKQYNDSNERSALYVIDDSWKNIMEYVMKIDNHDRQIDGENEIPIIDNLELINGKYFTISKLRIRATNISMPFFAQTEDGKELGIDSKKQLDITDAFRLELVPNNQVKIFLKKEILDEKHLFSGKNGFSGNLIRIDIIVDEFLFEDSMIEQFDSLEWISSGRNNPNKGKPAICVSKSIENAMKDKMVVPTSDNNKLLYTIFIQTESFN